MLRIIQSSSAKEAKAYYTSGLEDVGGYYAGEGVGAGLWFGKVAEMLGLSGEVDREQFHLLCDNRRPDTLGKLNPRENDRRKIGYDLTFLAPKGVSLLYSVVGDSRILPIFHRVVEETMRRVEADAHVRVRKGGVVGTRKTGNLLWSQFTHFEARPIDGIADPALHCHCYTFNTSFDPVEGRFKAGEFFPIKRDATYYEAIFHSELAAGMKGLGYSIENKSFGFEIVGLGEENLRRFSRRTKEIEEMAEVLGISGDDRAKDKLAAVTRQSKKLRLIGAAQLGEWRGRMDWSLLDLDRTAGLHVVKESEAVRSAIGHVFERQSVIPRRRLIAAALQNSLGDCDVEAIEAELGRRDDLISANREEVDCVTTREVLGEERSILEFLERTRADRFPIYPGYEIANEILDSDQKDAVEAMLGSCGRVFVLEGRAGTGKTTLMKEAIGAMEAAGERVFTFAPTSQASHEVLKAEGFQRSETIQRLLVDVKLQGNVRHGVLWIDEAGLLSTKEMKRLFEIVEEQGARVILSGDRRQHHSVERGDALRFVAASGLVEVSQTRTVHRQRTEAYRQAVTAMSEGDVADGIELLDSMGAIRECGDLQERLDAEAEEYVNSLSAHSSVLVVSPTHFEGRLVTARIRGRLQRDGKLAEDEVEIPLYQNRNLTEAERRLDYRYFEGDVIRFHQNARGGYRRGEVYRISKRDGLVFASPLDSPSEQILDFAVAKHYAVFDERKIGVAVGERVRLTRNAVALGGQKLYNGSVHEITGTNAGELVLGDRYRLPLDCGCLDYGYVSTSHSSQGKTAGKVIISQSSFSAGAASMEQIYVSASRGRDEIVVFTDEKAGLIESVRGDEQRCFASEMARDLRRESEEAIALSNAQVEEQELQLLANVGIGGIR